jgi:hypothetical protein
LPAPPQDWGALLGRKVSIRFVLRGDPEHPFSEAVGVVQGVRRGGRSDRIEILKRDGRIVSVEARDVLAAKVFPA